MVLVTKFSFIWHKSETLKVVFEISLFIIIVQQMLGISYDIIEEIPSVELNLTSVFYRALKRIEFNNHFLILR